MTIPPTGTVTFLFTDIEGSTKLWQEHPDQMKSNLARHDALLRATIEQNNGHVFKTVGDAFCAAFPTALQGVKAAIEAQIALGQESWGECVIKVRMGLHTGDAEERDNDYFGNTVNRAARLMSAGHGGQTLLSLATQELVRDKLPDRANLVDLGERRLKDLIRPEHIYQLNVHGLPSEFPPIKTLEKYRHNLPMQLTSFVGREKEMSELKMLLANNRLVTLTGAGGAGKTRLSLQIAADFLDQFSNGIWFIELASITDPNLIPQTILSVADAQAQSGRNPLDTLLDFLREKTSLLVLDNCEHLIEACAKLANTLLMSAPNLKILASSREALGVHGEQAWYVPSLSTPDVKHLPPTEQLSQYEAVRLFLDRALLVQPHFAITNENAPAVAQICSQLDGIPLAIELAAARIRMMNAEQISERLNDRFRLLTGGSRTALPRQQTLRALIDWSYELLSENEKILLRRLSVFMGGWSLDAAEQVCSDDKVQADDILDLLTHLVDKSLVFIDEQPGQLGYHMLETIRQYAHEKLFESGEIGKLQTQHLAYFLKFAEEAAPHLTQGEQLEWLDRLELNHENLKAAFEWSIELQHDDLSEPELRLVNALKFYWQLRGYWTEGKDWIDRAVAHDPNANHTVERARAFASASIFEWENIKKIIELCDKGLALGQELGDKPSMAESLLIKGIQIRNTVNNLQGRELLQESLRLFQELNDKRGIARALYNIGITISNQYDFPAARRSWEECLQLSRDVGDRRFTAIALLSLGGLEMNQGEWAAAKRYLQESVLLGKELGDKHGLSMYLSSLAYLEMGQGEYQKAQDLYNEGLVMAKELGVKTWSAGILYSMGMLARYQKNYEEATRLQKEFLAYGRESNDNSTICCSLYRLGELARLQSNYPMADSYLAESLTLAQEIDDHELITCCLEEFAALYMEQEQGNRAATLFGAAEALREQIHIVLLPVEKTEIDKNIADVRSQLDGTAFSDAWVGGRAMAPEQAVAYALKAP